MNRAAAQENKSKGGKRDDKERRREIAEASHARRDAGDTRGRCSGANSRSGVSEPSRPGHHSLGARRSDRCNVARDLPGAGGNIGVVQAAKSPPDGYTLLIASTGFVVNPSLFREPGYDPFRDFVPITELGSSPNVILVHPSSGITSIAQLIARAKAEKSPLNIINPGQGSTPHLTAELLQLRAGIAVENIPYNGAGPAIQALLANTTPVGITALPPAQAHIRSGALRALAVTGEKRWFDLPDVPTMQEAGYPGLVSETFQGMYAPAGTPEPIIRLVARDTLDVLADPATLEKLRSVGFDVRANGPQGLSERVAREVPMWREVIVRSGIELQ
jgi:tripartite-type tricarboxylate transporter receptor subunit TctC